MDGSLCFPHLGSPWQQVPAIIGPTNELISDQVGANMGHIVSPAAEELLDQTLTVHKHGFVRLVDYMGSDQSIVSSCFLVKDLIGLSIGSFMPSKSRPYQPSME